MMTQMMHFAMPARLVQEFTIHIERKQPFDQSTNILDLSRIQYLYNQTDNIHMISYHMIISQIKNLAQSEYDVACDNIFNVSKCDDDENNIIVRLYSLFVYLNNTHPSKRNT